MSVTKAPTSVARVRSLRLSRIGFIALRRPDKMLRMSAQTAIGRNARGAPRRLAIEGTAWFIRAREECHDHEEIDSSRGGCACRVARGGERACRPANPLFCNGQTLCSLRVPG